MTDGAAARSAGPGVKPSSGPSSDPSSGPSSEPGKAALWMLGSLASFTLMAIAGRELASDLNSFQILFWRSVIGLAIVACVIAASREGFAQIATQRPDLHGVRNVFHFFGQNCWFYAVATIPLAQVFAFEFTTPIWIARLAPLALGEPFTRFRMLAAALGFVGVLIVVRPGVAEFGFGQGVALVAAIGFAENVIATIKLSSIEGNLSILFWMTASQAVMAVVCDLVVSGSEALPAPTAETGFWVTIVALCGLSAHYSIAAALRCADATVVAPLDFFRLPVVAVAAALLYAEALDPFVFLGGALIFLGNFLNIRAEKRRLADAA
ncbi:MAG: DMT family transporter [Neomegalonema sp.]